MALWYNTIFCLYLIPHHGLQHKVQIMTGTEPLNEDGTPPHCKARTVKLEMEDKMVQIYKKVKYKKYGTLAMHDCHLKGKKNSQIKRSQV